jgi:hypothetical protein
VEKWKESQTLHRFCRSGFTKGQAVPQNAAIYIAEPAQRMFTTMAFS